MPRRRQTSPAQLVSHSETSLNEAGIPLSQVSHTAQDSGNREPNRFKIGYVYVWAFVLIIGGTLIISFWRCYTVNETKDLLLAISGILSGPLGFIIGFYFKESTESKKA